MYSSYLELLLTRDGISVDGTKHLWANSNSWSNFVHRNLNVSLFYSLFYSVTRPADKREVIMFLTTCASLKRRTGVKSAALRVTRHKIKVNIITVQFMWFQKVKRAYIWFHYVQVKHSKHFWRVMGFSFVWDEWKCWSCVLENEDKKNFVSVTKCK